MTFPKWGHLEWRFHIKKQTIFFCFKNKIVFDLLMQNWIWRVTFSPAYPQRILSLSSSSSASKFSGVYLKSAPLSTSSSSLDSSVNQTIADSFRSSNGICCLKEMKHLASICDKYLIIYHHKTSGLYRKNAYYDHSFHELPLFSHGKL